MTKPVDGAAALVVKVACAIYQEDTLDGLGKDVADRMMDRARAVLAIPDLRLAGVKEGLEMAAKVAETNVSSLTGESGDGFYAACDKIAAAIRAIPVKADDWERA